MLSGGGQAPVRLGKDTQENYENQCFRERVRSPICWVGAGGPDRRDPTAVCCVNAVQPQFARRSQGAPFIVFKGAAGRRAFLPASWRAERTG